MVALRVTRAIQTFVHCSAMHIRNVWRCIKRLLDRIEEKFQQAYQYSADKFAGIEYMAWLGIERIWIGILGTRRKAYSAYHALVWWLRGAKCGEAVGSIAKRHALWLLASAIPILFMYRQVAHGIFAIPRVDAPNMGLGILALIIMVWLTIQQLKQVWDCEAEPTGWGLVIILFGLLLCIAARRAWLYFLLYPSLAVTALGLVIYVFGWRIARQLAFPFTFLIAAAPLPLDIVASIAFPLQRIVARLSTLAVGSFGIPVVLQGLHLITPNAQVFVADQCSGMRSFTALFWLYFLALHLYARVYRLSWVKAVAAFLLLLPIAVFTNALRTVVVTILMNAGWSVGSQSALVHELLALPFFMMGVVLTIGILQYVPLQVDISKQLSRFLPTTRSSASFKLTIPMHRHLISRWVPLMCIGVALMPVSEMLHVRSVPDIIPPRPQLPIQVGEWSTANDIGITQLPIKLPTHSPEWTIKAYTMNQKGQQVRAFLILHHPPRGKELFRLRRAFLGQGFVVVWEVIIRVSGAPMRVCLLQRSNEAYLIIYAYVGEGNVVASYRSLRYRIALERLMYGMPLQWTLISICAPVSTPMQLRNIARCSILLHPALRMMQRSRMPAL